MNHATATASWREGSEDRAEVHVQRGTLVVIVADGAGGLSGGAEASDRVILRVRERVASPSFDPYDIRAWSELLVNVDLELARATEGETTAVVIAVGIDGIVGASAGDSEAWMVDGGRIDRLTAGQPRARIGSGRVRLAPFHRRALGGSLVVGTDGLFKHADRSAIGAACSGLDARATASRLIALPRSPSGAYADDVALVVVTASA